MKRSFAFALFLVGVAQAQFAPQKLENEYTKASIGNAEPGHVGKLHRHEVNRVMIHLDAGHQRQVFDGGKVRENHFKAGDVRWNQAGGMHTSENIGKADYHVAEIDVKKAGGTAVKYSKLDPAKVDPQHYYLEFENSQVRVTRVRFGPREKAPLHEHMLPRLTVTLTEQAVLVTDADGKRHEVRNPAGKMVPGVPTKHREENLNDSVFEAIIVEFKGK